MSDEAAAPAAPAQTQAPAPEQAVAPGKNQAPEAEATQATAPTEATEVSWDQVLQMASEPEPLTPGAPDTGAQPPGQVTPEAQPEGDGGPKPLPEVDVPRPRSAAERIMAKRAAEAERAKLAPLEAELRQRQEAIDARDRAFQAQQARIQEAAAAGNLDSYLQQTLGIGVQQYAQQQLEQASSTDPRVTQLQAEIQAIREQSAQRERQAQEQIARAEQAREMTDLKRDIAGSGFTGADKLAELPGFAAKVHAQLREGSESDFGKVLAVVAQEYKTAFQRLTEVFGTATAPASTPETPPAQAGVPPVSNRPETGSSSGPTTLPQSAAGEARGAGLEGMSDDDAWEAALALAAQSE